MTSDWFNRNGVAIQEPLPHGLMSMVTARLICFAMINKVATGSNFPLETANSIVLVDQNMLAGAHMQDLILHGLMSTVTARLT